VPALPSRRGDGRSILRTLAARLTPAVRALIVISTVLYLAFALVDTAQILIGAHLALGQNVWREPWQLVTSIVVEPRGQGLFFSALGLWFVGGELERTQGTRRFLWLFLASGFVGNLVIALVAPHTIVQVHAGMAPALLALFVAFARIYGPVPTTPFFVGPTIKASWAAAAFILLAVLNDLDSHDYADIVGIGAACLTAYVLATPGGLVDKLRLPRGKARYKVLEGGASPRKATGRHKYWN
jgi:membrane associated rhomboid family serine protease